MNFRAINYKGIPVQADILSGIIRLDVDAVDSLRELDRLVRSDQGVASLVIVVVNSPLYNRGRTVTTIPLAISVLGFNIVRSLALLAFARSLFSQTRDPQFRHHIWQHSLLTAIAAQEICQSLGAEREQDSAFVAGLMHDTGKLLLFTHARERYLQALALCLESGCSSVSAEQRFLGADHCQVGREAVLQWRLPDRFAEYMATDWSRPPPNGFADTVLLSLAAANYLIKASGIGSAQIADAAARGSGLRILGVAPEMAERLAQREFVERLFDNDMFKLCAAI